MDRSKSWSVARDHSMQVLAVFVLASVTGCGGDGSGSKNPSLFETPSISVSGVEVDEGNSGSTPAIFRVTLSTEGSDPVSAEWSTLDGTASAGRDYRPTSGKLVIEPGTTDTVVIVDVLGDRNEESDETFFLVLENPSGADLTAAEAKSRATVRDDDEEDEEDEDEEEEDEEEEKDDNGKRKRSRKKTTGNDNDESPDESDDD